MNEPSRSLIAQAIDTSIGILRLRKGPEDMPASGSLLLAAIVGAVLMRALLYAMPVPEGPQLNPAVLILLDIGLSIICWMIALRLAGHPARFQQTATSIFACQVVMTPALVLGRWLLVTYYETPGTMGVLSRLVYFAIAGWLFIVTVRILRSATGWPLLATIFLAFAIEMVMAMVLLMVFPPEQLALPTS